MFTDKLNFSQNNAPERAIKLYSKNRDLGYYYDNLCLYCANNDIDLDNIPDSEFSAAADIMQMHGEKDMSIDTFYFWIDA